MPPLHCKKHWYCSCRRLPRGLPLCFVGICGFHSQSANSNGLFSPVGKILGVSTNGAAPSISKLVASPVDAATNAAVLFLSMDAPGVTCRVWYTLLPLIDTVLLKTTPFSAEEVAEAAKPNSVIALPQVSNAEHKQTFALLSSVYFSRAMLPRSRSYHPVG